MKLRPTLLTSGTCLLAIVLLAVLVTDACKSKSGSEQGAPRPTNTKVAVVATKPELTAAAPTPVPPSPTVKGQFTTFGSGTKIVGTDIPPGTYRTRQASSGCYWARLSGFGGTLGEIIANENTDGPAIVTIASTDKGFESTRCDDWTSDLSAVTSGPTTAFGAGTFMVGVDVAPGTWRADGGGGCYWARLAGFSGALGEIIANDNGNTIVTIGSSDVGFTNSRCGTWSLVQ